MVKENKSNKIFFIKPFEVLSSYFLFVKTWNILKANYAETKEVTQARLFRALVEDASLGYISMSEWISKGNFKKAIEENSIFKYHHLPNKHYANAGTLNLFKKINEIYNNNKQKDKISFIAFIESQSLKQKEITEYWDMVVKRLKEQKLLTGSLLFKAISKKNKFGYVAVFNLNINEQSVSKIHLVNNILIENKSSLKKIYSVYKTVSLINNKFEK